MFSKDKSVLVVVDVQGKLSDLMFGREELIANLRRMISGAKILNIPILWNEQYPKGLGATIPEVAELLQDNNSPLEKMSFSCCGNDDFNAKLKELGRHQIILIGIETHVCVNQTAADLLNEGYEVEVIADAVSSRTLANKEYGLQRMKDHGAKINSTEMILFELLRVAGGDEFKKISKLVK